MNVKSIEATFRELRLRGETALIPYLTAGHPTLDATSDLIQAVAQGGADIIEVGVPFSDPVADGPTIQASSQIALRNGAKLRWCLEQIDGARQAGVETPIVLMGYCNPFLAYGIERLSREAEALAIGGMIVPDLPADHSSPWQATLRAAKLDLIFFLAPTTPSRRRREIARRGSGFIYCISVRGVTGARATVSDELEAFLAGAREDTDLPLAVGFGIATPDHVERVSRCADGAIVGSALIQQIEAARPADRCARARDFVARLKAVTHAGNPA